jgi:hypothetical protein
VISAAAIRAPAVGPGISGYDPGEMSLAAGDKRLDFILIHGTKPVPGAFASGLFENRPVIAVAVNGPTRDTEIEFAHRGKLSSSTAKMLKRRIGCRGEAGSQKFRLT